MEATAEAPIDTRAPARKAYSSRPGALIWFFRKSRDEWKAKCREAKGSLKREKNRVAELSKSREHWRTEAERAGRRSAELEAEVTELRSRLEAELEKKQRPDRRLATRGNLGGIPDFLARCPVIEKKPTGRSAC